MKLIVALAALFAAAEAFAPAAAPALRSRAALSKVVAAAQGPKMSLEMNALEQVSTTLAGVVAVDGGTPGLFIPVVFLVTLFIQSDAQGTATSFRQPDSIG